MREAGREPGQIEETEAEKGEIAHVRGCVLRDGIEPALALGVIQAVPAMSDLVELITMIPEKEIGIEIALERETKDLHHDDEAERGLVMTVIKRSHATRSLTRNVKKKRKNHLTDEALLDP